MDLSVCTHVFVLSCRDCMTSLPSEISSETSNATISQSGKPTVDLRCTSAESMGFLGDDALDLVVTSPPYWNAREYSKYKRGTKKDRTRDYRKGFGDGSYEAYLALMSRSFAQVYRVLKPGGICCVNMSSVLYMTRMYPIPADLTKRLIELGFEMKEELIWDKTHSACDRFGSFAQNPLPHLYYPNLSSERILIMRKPGPRAAKTADPAMREASRLPLTKLATTEISNDVWHIAALRHGEVEHCARFPRTSWQGWCCCTHTRARRCLIRFWAAGR